MASGRIYFQFHCGCYQNSLHVYVTEGLCYLLLVVGWRPSTGPRDHPWFPGVPTVSCQSHVLTLAAYFIKPAKKISPVWSSSSSFEGFCQIKSGLSGGLLINSKPIDLELTLHICNTLHLCCIVLFKNKSHIFTQR